VAEIQRDRAIRILLDRGAARIDHLNGTLLKHLERTEELLRRWGASGELALAGLCHAVYGTDGFPVSLLTIDRRDLVSEAIGTEAESIVYLYASCDRQFLYPQIGTEGVVTFRDRFTSNITVPTAKQIQLLVDLTLANEADVAIISSTSAEVPGWFVSLVRQFGPVASDDAAQSCEQLITFAE
jgi:hypothetical protein